MSRHTAPPLGPAEVIVARIHQRIHDLTAPSTTVTDQWLLRPPWLRLRVYPHVVEHPSLVDQLRDCSPASTAGGGGGASSKPAANLTPLSELHTITVEARRWVEYGLRLQSTGVVEDLRTLDQRAATLDDLDALKDLDWHVTRWWAHARLVTTWDSAPLKVYAHCDQCGTRGSLQVVTEPMAAVCFACGATWDSMTIGALGEHVRMMLDVEREILVPDEVRDAEVDDAPEVPAVLQGTTYSA